MFSGSLIVTSLVFHIVSAEAISQYSQTPIERPSITKTEQRDIIAVVLRSWTPQYSLNNRGKPIGFAIDVLEAVSERAGRTVKISFAKTRPQSWSVPIEWSSLNVSA